MLVEALTSALQQDTTLPIEIIVVDNDPASEAKALSSVDLNTSTHAVRYYINDSNVGMLGNWNQCIALARGKWITLLHDDDWLAPGFVSAMLRLVMQGYDFAVCRVKVGSSNFKPEILRRTRDTDDIEILTVDDLIFGNPTPAPGLLILKEALAATGGFDPAAYPCADYVTYARCATNVRSGRLNRTLAYYRTTDSQTFKEDTLWKIIQQSNEIKLRLLRVAPKASTATYILSMAFWFRLASAHGIPLIDIQMDWRLKCARILSRSRLITLPLELIRKSIKYLHPHN